MVSSSLLYISEPPFAIHNDTHHPTISKHWAAQLEAVYEVEADRLMAQCALRDTQTEVIESSDHISSQSVISNDSMTTFATDSDFSTAASSYSSGSLRQSLISEPRTTTHICFNSGIFGCMMCEIECEHGGIVFRCGICLDTLCPHGEKVFGGYCAPCQMRLWRCLLPDHIRCWGSYVCTVHHW